YMQCVYTSEMAHVAREQRRLSQEELTRRMELADAGKIAAIEIEEARAQFAKDQLSEITAANDSVMALVELATMLHLRDTDGFRVAPIVDRSAAPLPSSALAVFEAAIGHNHEVVAGRLKVHAAEKYIRLSETGYIPRLSFNAGLGSGYYTVSGFNNDPFHTQMHNNFSTYLGLSLQIPLFDAFSTRNTVRKAKLNRLSAQLELETKEDELYTSVVKAWQSAVNASKRLESAIIAESATYTSMLAVQEKYSVGRATPTEFDVAKNQWIQAASECVQARCELELRRRVLEFYATGSFR
ncbi:MAG: TolC family protein, partial [Muribaculaceae bacterium]|nr:TolC family protein [Muribaculaceae bacterium]